MHDKIAFMSEHGFNSRGLSAVVTAVVSWGVLIVISRVLVAGYGLNPWVLSFIQMAVGGAAMIVAAGPGRFPLKAMRHPHTWVYGSLRVLTAATLTAALAYATSAEISVLSALFIPIGILLAWGLFGRRPGPADALGSLVVLAGIAGVAAGLPGGLLGTAATLMVISAGATALGTAIAEMHPENRGDDRKTRLRLTGAAMLATAVLMLAAAMAASHLDPDGLVAAHVPLEAAADPRVWIAGVLVGVLVRGPSTYFTFRAIRLVGSENYLMGVALMPALNLSGEFLAASFGLLPAPALSGATLAAGALGIAGAVAIATLRWRARAAQAA
ncbi:hypothetical protein GCM10017083_53670 [Thalassobaculum fulvum]|uniref:EamA domain-containing protein n=2 Tax=Thalassobaculum fulvum TaxID=1633335 RepID=A0A918XXK6_9PROT|nr:hypothetical protein GCM10017083_53670 [Thalassobaculum fulvum]